MGVAFFHAASIPIMSSPELAPITIGLLGAGNWARTAHLPNLRQIPGVRVAAVSSNNLEHRAQAREAWGGPLCFYEDPLDLLEDPEIAAVVVGTPNHTHQALAEAALHRGKHVYCEKPIAFTPEGADRIRAAWEAAGTVFQSGLELRYCDVVRRMVERIGAGAIGEPRFASCLLLRDWGSSRGWRGHADQSGGMLLELGIHYFDLFNALIADRPARVFASGSAAVGRSLPDTLSCTVEYARGARGHLGISVMTAARKEVRLQVVGTEARLEGEILGGELSLWRRGAGAPEDLSPTRPDGYRFHGYPGLLEALEDWVRCIRTGDRPLADLEIGTLATAVSAAGEQSLQTGLPVGIESPGRP